MVNFQQDSSFEERKAGAGSAGSAETTAGTAAHIKLSGGKWLMSHGGNDGPWSARNLGIQLFFSTRIRCCCCFQKTTSSCCINSNNRWKPSSGWSPEIVRCLRLLRLKNERFLCSRGVSNTRQPWLWRIGDICWNKHNLYYYSFSFMLSSKVWILSSTGARGYNFSW